ncbi:fasciclin domain-containing protein [Wenxinia saemankumensis]|uniref:Uncaracterized surface protein containing fasciclin (FAS1) repeats n=1 Tax=Wenxinia saemankumensis TaxID=1447782 RepID=A0A1M6BX76_9RHOB|nr:fasciclin domain-containing protein [Wenxinia saemankumensis]SHI53104.1 Uncaracterized surface protein containing fasciclin (FAS1) repeats [Wenxinia saemankumensis]
MIRTFATSATLAVALGSAALAQDSEMTIVETAQATEDLSTLVTAVEAAGLVETLNGEGPFTVFAPTNAAFDALPEGTLDSLLADPETLGTILQCHVVEGEVMADALVGMIEDDGGEHAVPTLGGCELTAALDGENVTLTDENGTTVTVTMADVAASNGVVHVIDGVVQPAM